MWRTHTHTQTHVHTRTHTNAAWWACCRPDIYTYVHVGDCMPSRFHMCCADMRATCGAWPYLTKLRSVLTRLSTTRRFFCSAVSGPRCEMERFALSLACIA